MTSAALCRRNSWHPGTVLAGPDGAVVVTAVGETAVLARLVAVRAAGGWVRWPCGEAAWDLAGYGTVPRDEAAVLRAILNGGKA